MTEIQIHSETFTVLKFRRNYKRCRQCHAPTGTVILSVDAIPFEPPMPRDLHPEAEKLWNREHPHQSLSVGSMRTMRASLDSFKGNYSPSVGDLT
jgi:hypothetical protein